MEKLIKKYDALQDVYGSKELNSVYGAGCDKNAKVVMVSALGKEELVKKSLMLGVKSYIIKPLDRKKVLERISKILG